MNTKKTFKTLTALFLCMAVLASAVVFHPEIVPAKSILAAVEKKKTIYMDLLEMAVGGTEKLKVPGKKAKVKWSSSDKSVAKVTKKGTVTAVAPGEAVLTGKAGKKKYTCPVCVYDLDSICNMAYDASQAKDYERAYDLWTKAGEQGSGRALYNLSYMYQKGLFVEQSDEKAVDYYLRAGEAGYDDGYLHLAYWYQNGVIVEQSIEKAIKYYELAGELGNGDAYNNLGVIYYNGEGVEKSEETALHYYLLGVHAKKPSSIAMCNASSLFFEGTEIPRDYKRSFEYAMMAYEMENAYSYVCLARLYMIDEEIKQDYDEAWKLLHQTAEAGQPGYGEYLGEFYRDGLNGVEIDYETAADYFWESATIGSKKSLAKYEALKEEGKIPDNYEPKEVDPTVLCDKGMDAFYAEDYETAVGFFQRAADLYSARGQYDMGLIYQNGYGVEQTYEEAKKYYLLAIEQDYSNAMVNLAYLYEKGYLEAPSEQEVIDLNKKAADLGNEVAMFNLGSAYFYGKIGVEQSYETAYDYFQQAADLNYATAIYSIGYMYYFGYAVEQSYEKAYQQYLKAAKLGEANAFEAVGEYYRDGIILEQNFETAADYFHKAVEMGCEEAQADYDKLIADGKIKADYVPKEVVLPEGEGNP